MTSHDPGALWTLLGVPAAVDPDRPMLTTGDRTLTYTEMIGEAKLISTRLDGEPVALLDVNSVTAILLMYACFSRGAPFVPLNYRLRAPEIAGILSRAELPHLVIGDRYREVAESVRESWSGSVTELSDLGRGSAALSGPDRSDGRRSRLSDVMLFTSGTSKAPKPIQLDGQEVANFVLANTPACPPETRDESLLMSMPLYHVAGLLAVLRSVFAGRRVTVIEQFEAGRWIAEVESQRISHAFVVPTMLTKILDHPGIADADLSSIKTLTYGGGPMPRTTITRALEVLPESIGLVGVYGMTEASGTVCVLDEDDHRAARQGGREAVELLGSVGRPVADVVIEILAEDGGLCPPREVGEITVTGTRISEAVSTAADGGGRVLRTGDRGWLNEAGYLFFAGRADDMIVRGGENISPAEIEDVLRTAATVADCSVVGLSDETWGHLVVAAVVPRDGVSVDPAQLKQECRDRIAGYKWPDHIIEVAELPLNPTGKVIKKELLELIKTELETTL